MAPNSTSSSGEKETGVLGLTANQKWQFFLSIAATLLLGGYFLSIIPLTDVFIALSDVSYRWYAFAALCMLLHTIFRSMRIQALVGVYIDQKLLISTCAFQSFLGMILPSGLAQAVFIYLLNKLHAVSLFRGITSVVAMRVLDLAMFLTLVLLFGIALNSEYYSDLFNLSLIFFGLLVAGILMIWLIKNISVVGIISMLGIRSSRLTSLILHANDEFFVVLRHLTNPKFVLITAGNWVSLFGCYVGICWSIGVELSLMGGIFAFALLMIVNLLPIHGIAGVGTHHLAWVLVLSSVGVNEITSNVVAGASHLILVSLYTLWALPACTYLLLRRRQSS